MYITFAVFTNIFSLKYFIFCMLRHKLLLLIPFIGLLFFHTTISAQWSYLGSDSVSDGPANFTLKVAVNNAGVPYVAFTDNAYGQVRVMRFINDAWESVGNNIGPMNYANYVKDFVITTDGTLYVTTRQSNVLTIMRLDGSSWTTVTSAASFPPTISGDNAREVYHKIAKNGTQYLLQESVNYPNEKTNLKLSVFNNNTWTTLNTTSLPKDTISVERALHISANNVPYFIADGKGTYSQRPSGLRLYKFLNNVWQQVGQDSIGIPDVNSPEPYDFQLAADGTPYILYTDENLNRQMVVKRFLNNQWSVVGAGPLTTSNLTLPEPSIFITNNNDVYISYLDNNAWGAPIVRKLENNAWVSLANTRAIHRLSLAVSAGQVFLGGINWNNQNRLAVLTRANPTIPVELIDFVGEIADKTNQLSWTTASEKNNLQFTVERSKDGKHFTAIGTVKGNGTTSAVSRYTFTDNTPLSISYYRLIQTDMDGKKTTCKTITLARKEAKMNILKVFPSITTDVLTVETVTDGKATLMVVDAVGRSILTQNIAPTNGFNTTPLSVCYLPNGVYMLILTTQNGQSIERFVKY
jgi:hypothetical protein